MGEVQVKGGRRTTTWATATANDVDQKNMACLGVRCHHKIGLDVRKKRGERAVFNLSKEK